jgi:hypothetical protein
MVVDSARELHASRPTFWRLLQESVQVGQKTATMKVTKGRYVNVPGVVSHKQLDLFQQEKTEGTEKTNSVSSC